MTDAREPLPQAEDFAAALDWWREAGVDSDFADAATNWLAPPVAPTEQAAAPVPKRQIAEPAEPAGELPFGGDAQLWPASLDAFRELWLTAPALEDGGIGPRVAPRGRLGADLMVLVAMPEEDDTETLLSGAGGRLITGFLRAAGIDAENVYYASVLPRCTAMPDLARDGLGQVLRHHAALVGPGRILALGRNILPLLSHEPAQAPAILPQFNHEGRSVPLLEARGPAELLRSARARADLWRRWLEWTDA